MEPRRDAVIERKKSPKKLSQEPLEGTCSLVESLCHITNLEYQYIAQHGEILAKANCKHSGIP